MRERETVWCEAHGGLANPHFLRDDCVHPHYTDQKTRTRMTLQAVCATFRSTGVVCLGHRTQNVDSEESS